MNVTLIYNPNAKSGAEVRVHRTGCQDIRKASRNATTVYAAEVSSQAEAASDFYSDFISEGSMTEDDAQSYTDFLPCTKGLN